MLAYALQSDWAHSQLLAVRLPWSHQTLAQAVGRLPQAASGACPGHRALAPGRIGRLSRPHRGAPPVSIYAALIGRTPNRYGRAHSQAAPGALPVSMQATRLGALPVLRCCLPAVCHKWSAHFRHRPMRLRTVHRGWAHSHPFGGNVSTFNANATSQACTRFAQLVWPHLYCWYPPKIRKKHLSWSTASLQVCKLTALLSLLQEGVIRRRKEGEIEGEQSQRPPNLHATPSIQFASCPTYRRLLLLCYFPR